MKHGTNVPVHSQEHCTRKADRPPSLQRACNVTVGEEQRRTLFWFRFDLWTGKSSKQQNRDAVACSLRSEKEAKHYLKITLARRKTCTEAARPSFPGDTSFTQGDSGPANEEQLPFSQRHFSLSLFHFPLHQIPPSLITTPSSHLWGTSQTSSFSTHNPPRFGVALGPGSGPSSDQKVRGSCSQSQAPNCSMLCLSWDYAYVSWWAGEQKVLHYTKTVHLPSRFTFIIIVRISHSH